MGSGGSRGDFYCKYYSPNKVGSQGRVSYFAFRVIPIPLKSAKARSQPKYLSLKYLSPAANSLEIRIAGRQPKYLSLKYLSPAVNSLEIRIARRQPRPGYLSLGT